jgi:hypothetical protein
VYLTKERLRLYLVALLVLQIVLCVRLLPFALHGKSDFRSFYTAGHMLRTGDPLYNYQAEQSAQSALVSSNLYALPFLSPPYTALLFVPLSFVSYWPGYLLFFALNLCFSALAASILHPHLALLQARWPPLTLLLFLSFMPLGIALTLGQVSIVLLLLYCASFAATQNARPFLAGTLLSLALIKFQIALPVALLFLLWRQWRFIAGFLTGTFALTLISILITGPTAFAAYLRSIFFMSRASSSAIVEPRYGMFPQQMPNLYGFFHAISHGAAWGLPLTILCSLLVILRAATRKPSLPLALLAGLLVSYHLYLYDLTLLLLPISLVFNRNIDSHHPGREKAALYASFFFVLASLWGTAIRFDYHYLIAIPLAVLFACFSPSNPELSVSNPAHAPR